MPKYKLLTDSATGSVPVDMILLIGKHRRGGEQALLLKKGK